MPVHSDRALILRRFPFGESSLVVQVLTPHFGRVHLMAKGAYRPRGPFSWALDLFDTLALEWTSRRLGELDVLRTAHILTRRLGVTADLARYRGALLALELSGMDAREGELSGELFALLEQSLDEFAAREPDAARVQVAFELAFLRHLGLAPALVRCAACGGDAPGRADGRAEFSATSGGRLCAAHAAEFRAAGRRVGTLPSRLLEGAAALLEGGSQAPLAAFVGPTTGGEGALGGEALLLQDLSQFAARYLEVHLEARPKSYAAARGPSQRATWGRSPA